MASFLQGVLGGVAEGLNEQFDMKRKEDRANRMLEKELTLKRDFALEDEKRQEEKLAKENIQALNAYYNPANVDRIVKAGNIAVSTALERAKADPYTNHNKFINPEYIQAATNSKVKYVGDKGWDGWVKGLGNQKLPTVTKRKAATGPQQLFKTLATPLTTDDTNVSEYDELLVMAELDEIKFRGKPEHAEAVKRLKAIEKIVASKNKTARAEKTSPINTLSNAAKIVNSYVEMNDVGGVYNEGLDTFSYDITEGNKNKFYTASLYGNAIVNDKAIRLGYENSEIDSRRLADNYQNRLKEIAQNTFAKNAPKGQIIDGGENASFQFTKSGADMQKRIATGKVPEGAVISYMAQTSETKQPVILSVVYSQFADKFEDLENNSYRIQPHVFTDVSNYKFN